jgi:hypothetical protein
MVVWYCSDGLNIRGFRVRNRIRVGETRAWGGLGRRRQNQQLLVIATRKMLAITKKRPKPQNYNKYYKNLIFNSDAWLECTSWQLIEAFLLNCP